MRPTRPLLALTAIALACPLLARHTDSKTADVRPVFEAGALYAPTFGNGFDGLSGGGIFGSLGVEYAFNDSDFDEFALCQVEGIFLHGEGTNDIGGVRHRETLDAGYAFLNLGLGLRNEDIAFTVLVGLGVGGGDLQGEIVQSDTALTNALQIKPRLTWYVSRHWQVFAEYRFITTSSTNGHFFDHEDRKMEMHAVGLGVVRRF